MRIALFVTCLNDTFYPRTGIAVVKVLEKLGCEVEFPKAQTCCGQPMWNNGFTPEARVLARKMITVFEEAQYVVTPSGSCAAMVREHYEQAFEHDAVWRDRARRLAAKTYEFVEFLDRVLKVDLTELGVRWEGKAAYHYSCHLRALGIKADDPQRLMRQVEGLDVMPLDKQEQCCGFGGTFAMKYPDISGAMVNDKVSCIQAADCDAVISNDAGCTMNIAGACRRAGEAKRFITLAEVIAEGMGLMDKGE